MKGFRGSHPHRLQPNLSKTTRSLPSPPGHAEADAGLGEDVGGIAGVVGQLAPQLDHHGAHGPQAVAATAVNGYIVQNLLLPEFLKNTGPQEERRYGRAMLSLAQDEPGNCVPVSSDMRQLPHQQVRLLSHPGFEKDICNEQQ